ncbi:MAG: SprT family zinc-dependent metalloprotease [Chloroflexia bacterium]
MPTITLHNRIVPYTVRRSPRARQIRLRVGPNLGLEVVVPARGQLPDIPALLRERAAWILRALDRVAAQAVPAAPALASGTTLPYLGLDHRLIVAPGPGVPPAVLHDPAARTLTARFDPAVYDLRAVLDWWFRNRARETLAARVAHFSDLLNVRHSRLTIRDTRTRWGSCSSRGGINFSWRLILAPPPILDYVVIHELAHLRELNHSPRFWAILAHHCPDYPSHQAWLKEHGATLHTILADPETP